MMSLKRWYYRGGRPNRVARALDRCTAALYAHGVAPNYLVVLEVPGRRSDRPIALPLVMVVVEGERYLVSMLGEKANWVRNVRAAGDEVTLRHGRREEVRLEEVAVNHRAPLLKAYLKRAPNARAHLPVDKDAPLAEFERVAHRFPVFRVAGSTMICGILSPPDAEGSLRENEACSRPDQRGERTSTVHNPMSGATSRRGSAPPGLSTRRSRLRAGTVRVRPSVDFVAPETLGFESGSEGWWKIVGERRLLFTRLRSRLDLEKSEQLQRTVFGVSDRDLASSSILVTVHETGGEVLGVFDGERLVGFVSGWGGYVDGRARVVSDLMAVEVGYRGGLGFALKELQAVVAFQAGFEEIVWTVDPLRAANARLNFERLGAHARKYMRNVYGEHFGEGLYGGLPSDRLFVTWPLRSARVRSRLLGSYQPLAPGALATLPEFAPDTSESRVRLAVTGDFDGLLASDPGRAREWRFRLRDSLEAAFASGYVLTGFAGRRGEPHGYYLLERDFVFE